MEDRQNFCSQKEIVSRWEQFVVNAERSSWVSLSITDDSSPVGSLCFLKCLLVLYNMIFVGKCIYC